MLSLDHQSTFLELSIYSTLSGTGEIGLWRLQSLVTELEWVLKCQGRSCSPKPEEKYPGPLNVNIF